MRRSGWTFGGSWAIWLILAAAAFAAEEKPADVRSISTSGEAVIYVVPDEIIVNFGIETVDADLEKAKATNDAASTGWCRPSRRWASKPNTSRPTTSTSRSATRTATAWSLPAI